MYVNTISGKTIRIKCDKKQKADTVSKTFGMRTATPLGITYLTHQGKMLKNKKTIEENNIEVESTIEMSMRLLGRMDENSSETEEERENMRKLEETSKGKSRLSDESVMKRWKLTQEKPSKRWTSLTAKRETTRRKQTKRWIHFCRQSQIQSEHSSMG